MKRRSFLGLMVAAPVAALASASRSSQEGRSRATTGAALTYKGVPIVWDTRRYDKEPLLQQAVYKWRQYECQILIPGEEMRQYLGIAPKQLSLFA